MDPTKDCGVCAPRSPICGAQPPWQKDVVCPRTSATPPPPQKTSETSPGWKMSTRLAAPTLCHAGKRFGEPHKILSLTTWRCGFTHSKNAHDPGFTSRLMAQRNPPYILSGPYMNTNQLTTSDSLTPWFPNFGATCASLGETRPTQKSTRPPPNQTCVSQYKRTENQSQCRMPHPHRELITAAEWLFQENSTPPINSLRLSIATSDAAGT